MRNVQEIYHFENSLLVVFWASWKVGGTLLTRPGWRTRPRDLSVLRRPPLKFDPAGVGDQTARPLGADLLWPDQSLEHFFGGPGN